MPSSRLSQGYHGPVPFTLTSLYCLTSGSKRTGLSKPTGRVARMAEAAGSLAKRLLCCRERPNMLQATYFMWWSTDIHCDSQGQNVKRCLIQQLLPACVQVPKATIDWQKMPEHDQTTWIALREKKGRQLEQNLKHHNHVCLLLL